MAVNMDKVNEAIARATAQLEQTKTVEGSATVLIKNFAEAMKAAVTEALTKDNDATNESIRVAVEAMDQVTAAYGQSEDELGAAITAGTPSA